MYEVELKVRADHAAVRSRLESIGAESIGVVRQEDTYYDAPHRSFARTDEALRIRRESSDASGRTATLTYKGPLVERTSKTRLERETLVGDPASMDAILAELGFEPAATVSKHRERFRLDEYTISLDEVADVGEFVEIETHADEGGITTARDRAASILDSLDLDPEAHVRTSYLAMVLDE